MIQGGFLYVNPDSWGHEKIPVKAECCSENARFSNDFAGCLIENILLLLTGLRSSLSPVTHVISLKDYEKHAKL
jgi:hypothetical protein